MGFGLTSGSETHIDGSVTHDHVERSANFLADEGVGAMNLIRLAVFATVLSACTATDDESPALGHWVIEAGADLVCEDGPADLVTIKLELAHVDDVTLVAAEFGVGEGDATKPVAAQAELTDDGARVLMVVGPTRIVAELVDDGAITSVVVLYDDGEGCETRVIAKPVERVRR
jgi:hypothetical protein